VRRVAASNLRVPAIETEQLTKHYGPVRALDRVSLAAPAGSIFGFLGPNGAGKSTTIRILMGLMRATAGRASVLGMDCWRDSLRTRRRIGYLPGDVRFYNQLTGRQTLEFLAAGRRIDAAGEIERLTLRFGLALDRRVRAYSRGMKQQLGLIQALMHKPELLILDEPTSSLDPLLQQVLYDELRAAAKQGATVLFSSHTLAEVEALCEHVAIVREGRLVEHSPIEQLRARALRRVSYTLRDGVCPPPPEGFNVRERLERRWSGTWAGPIDDLIRWLAATPIENVTIGPPDLEELFLEYYHSQPEGAPA